MVSAFEGDILIESFFKDEVNWKDRIHWVYVTILRYTVRYGEVCSSSCNLEGVCGVLPGKYSNMSFLRLLLSGGFFTGMKLGRKVNKKFESVFGKLGRDRHRIMEGDSYNYLEIIGVSKKYQGMGFGKILLSHIIKESMNKGMPLYLETDTENNCQMYQKFGFKLENKVVVPELGIPIWQMSMK